jgi:aspartate racemase
MSDLFERIANLPPEKRAFLERQLLGRKAQTSPEPALLRRKAANPAPLSFAQQRIWFVEHLEPGTSLYNISRAMRLSGPLDVAALQRALDTIVVRHAALRTTFLSVDGTPWQAIAAPRPVELAVIDLNGCLVSQHAEEVQHRLEEEAQRPFDLDASAPRRTGLGSLFRTVLFRLGPDEHALLVSMHHIVSDGWSMGVLFRELSALYQAFSTGKPSPLPELPVQYADFAVWQRQWLQGTTLEAHLSYWRERLRGQRPILSLPTDRARPAVPSYRGAWQPLALPGSLVEALKELARREGATLFMALLAAFQSLLYRYTGETDLSLGSPIANRSRAELEGLIGFFANTLVLRTDLSGNPTFRQLLARVRDVSLGAYAHQDLPFEKLVEELRPERDRSYNPLFQVAFSFHNTGERTLELPGLTVTPMPIGSGTAKFDLTLFLMENETELQGLLEYSSDLFDAGTIERMAGHFRILLEGIADDPEQRLSALPLLTERERRQLLVDWNQTRREYPRDVCVHQLFEAQVARRPDAVAVVFGTEQLTYAALNARANQLAHHLQRLGVGPEGRVGICVERSLDLIVGLLAILKAGGAYLPLDPSYPSERLAFMLEDAQAPVLLTQAQLVDRVRGSSAQVVCLDRDWPQIARASAANPASRTSSENLAYVIYTSGSSGTPKGVCIPHRAVLRLVCNSNYVNLTAADRVAQASTAAFDAATFEIWGALLHGSRLVGMSREEVLSPSALARRLREEGITTLFLTTALFQELARERPGIFQPVRHLLFGGEAVDPERVREVLADSPPARLLHVYGPTETTTFATWYEVEAVAQGARTIPIGGPLTNTELYVLDERLAPVPVGVAGELHIGGAGLARGYLNRPGLTAEKFVPHPFSRERGARLFRTGDRVRCRGDGSLEFLGRLDQQVKIRGFRIEPGEVGAALRQHAGVREAVVLPREDQAGEKRLVAYVVPHPEAQPTGSELRQSLQERLPEYLIPAYFVMLEALPLTHNGKLDRSALPTPDPAPLETQRAFAAPRDPIERQLAGIWEKLLGIRPIGIHDSFFDLGGHSLLAVRLVTAIERALGQRVPVAAVFQARTVEQLAALLRQQGGTPLFSSLVALQPEGHRPPFFCVHGRGDGVLCYHELSRHLGEDQPFYGLLGPSLSEDWPGQASVEEMAARYLREIRTRQAAGPYYLGGYSFGGIVAFEMAQQLQAQGETVALLALFDTGAPDIGKPTPLAKRVRCHLQNIVRASPGERVRYARIRVKAVQEIARTHLWSSLYRHQPRLAARLARAGRNAAAANMAAYREFQPAVYAGRLTLFRAQETSVGSSSPPDRGWSRFAGGGLEIHEVPGDHISMLEEPHVRSLAERLRECLEKAQGEADAHLP